jgi:hypothetical protein
MPARRAAPGKSCLPGLSGLPSVPRRAPTSLARPLLIEQGMWIALPLLLCGLFCFALLPAPTLDVDR